MTDAELELVVLLVQIGREDRDLYRQLRAEIWTMARRRHKAQSPIQRAAWLADAS